MNDDTGSIRDRDILYKQAARVAIEECELMVVNLIHEILYKDHGEYYWSKIPTTIRDSIESRIAARLDKNPGRKPEIYASSRSKLNLCSFDHLKCIITYKKFWKAFESKLGNNKNTVLHHLDAVRDLRNDLAHNNYVQITELAGGIAGLAWLGETLKGVPIEIPQPTNADVDVSTRGTENKTEQPRTKKNWTYATYLEVLQNSTSDKELNIAKRIIEYFKQHDDLFGWGEKTIQPRFTANIKSHSGDSWKFLSIWHDGKISISFETLRTQPPFDLPSSRDELWRRLNITADGSLARSVVEQRSFKPFLTLESLLDSGKLDELLSTLDWIREQVMSNAQ
jgi:hypothetical protein